MRDESDLALERYVVYHAQQILRCHSVKTIYIRFPSWFGLSPFVFVQLWKRLVTKGLLYNAKVYHALWALIFLKMYVYEDLLSTIVGADRKTVRKWVCCKFPVAAFQNISCCILILLFSDYMEGQIKGRYTVSLQSYRRWNRLPHPATNDFWEKI
jgi:hypothetical protein